ncbi:hypothetical protein LLG90_11460 [Aromatoleum toluclasticum]|uniref:hypothetical protein n=1 Tax=Aromatoleum toluclasticum TaxID=92003 RepID=UPI001D196009|nr:hypothetical protein [Aromatoleum toluclasticum]MCC4115966.1 hypothetical protein [Aromatoleum toluclasticum]
MVRGIAAGEQWARQAEAAEAAFAEVLAAEREAEEAVAACRASVARLRAEAEEAVMCLADEAEQRVQAWQARRAGIVAGELAELERKTIEAAGPVVLDASARERLARAVERLAEELSTAVNPR